MTQYLASMLFTGQAESVEAFIDLLHAAMAGDDEARRAIQSHTPCIVVFRDEDDES